jgi:hypothetical protein
MVSWEKINEIPGKTRKLKDKKKDKKREKKKPKTRRFWIRKKERKEPNIQASKNLYTDISESDILQPLYQKGGKIQNPRLTVNTYAKGLENEIILNDKPFLDANKDPDAKKTTQETPTTVKETEIIPYDIGTESTVPHDNVGSVNDFFRQMLDDKAQWERTQFKKEKIYLPQGRGLDETEGEGEKRKSKNGTKLFCFAK